MFNDFRPQKVVKIGPRNGGFSEI